MKKCYHVYGSYITEDSYINEISCKESLEWSENSHDRIWYDYCPSCGAKINRKDLEK